MAHRDAAATGCRWRTLRDRRPGRMSAESSTPGRLVAASSSTPGRPSNPSSSAGSAAQDNTPSSCCSSSAGAPLQQPQWQPQQQVLSPADAASCCRNPPTCEQLVERLVPLLIQPNAALATCRAGQHMAGQRATQVSPHCEQSSAAAQQFPSHQIGPQPLSEHPNTGRASTSIKSTHPLHPAHR